MFTQQNIICPNCLFPAMHDGMTRKGRLFLVCEACSARFNNIGAQGIIMMSQLSEWMESVKGGTEGLRSLVQARLAALQAAGSKIPAQITQADHEKIDELAERQRSRLDSE